jgi:hypothetical protein
MVSVVVSVESLFGYNTVSMVAVKQLLKDAKKPFWETLWVAVDLEQPPQPL